VVRSTDSFRYRLYYAYTAVGSTIPAVLSAVTAAPDPQGISPGAANRSDPPTAVTVGGEVFSPGAAVRLTRAGQADIVGSSVTRVNDQTITATFDTTGKDLGRWNLVVTNSDGVETTFLSAFAINFSAGQFSILDNLLRPRNNVPAQISVTIFDPGKVTVKIYAMDGRLVKTLIDEELALGTTTRPWDATTDDGQPVASGTYMIRAQGPKLNFLEKMVVIR
jgi:hypothetical protein